MSLQSEITRITNAKALIVATITSKGITVPSGARLEDINDIIAALNLCNIVSEVPTTKNTDIIYNTTDSTYYIWTTDGYKFLIRVNGTTADYVVAPGYSITQGDFIEFVPASGCTINNTDLANRTTNLQTCKLSGEKLLVINSATSGEYPGTLTIYANILNLSTYTVDTTYTIYNLSTYFTPEFTVSSAMNISDNYALISYGGTSAGEYGDPQSSYAYNDYYNFTSSNIKVWNNAQTFSGSVNANQNRVGYRWSKKLADNTYICIVGADNNRSGTTYQARKFICKHMSFDGTTYTELGTLNSDSAGRNDYMWNDGRWIKIGNYIALYRDTAYTLYNSDLSTAASGTISNLLTTELQQIQIDTNTQLVIGLDSNNYLSATIISLSGTTLSCNTSTQITASVVSPSQVCYQKLSDARYTVYALTNNVLTSRDIILTDTTITYTDEKTIYDFSTLGTIDAISLNGDYLNANMLYVLYSINSVYYLWNLQSQPLVKTCSEMIDGIAKTSGTAGNTITTIIPSTAPTYVKGTPINVATEAEMNKLTSVDNAGKYYKYTGTSTSEYTQNAIYTLAEKNTIETDLEIAKFFSISNDTYYFANSSGAWKSNNQSQKSTTAQTIWTCTEACTLSMTWRVSSQEGYDYFYILYNSTQLVQSSGENSGTITQAFAVGDTFTLQYAKNKWTDTNEDMGMISNPTVDPAIYSMKRVITAESDTTATASDIITSKTAYNSAGELLVGTHADVQYLGHTLTYNESRDVWSYIPTTRTDLPKILWYFHAYPSGHYYSSSPSLCYYKYDFVNKTVDYGKGTYRSYYWSDWSESTNVSCDLSGSLYYSADRGGIYVSGEGDTWHNSGELTIDGNNFYFNGGYVFVQY